VRLQCRCRRGIRGGIRGLAPVLHRPATWRSVKDSFATLAPESYDEIVRIPRVWCALPLSRSSPPRRHGYDRIACSSRRHPALRTCVTGSTLSCIDRAKTLLTAGLGLPPSCRDTSISASHVSGWLIRELAPYGGPAACHRVARPRLWPERLGFEVGQCCRAAALRPSCWTWGTRLRDRGTRIAHRSWQPRVR